MLHSLQEIQILTQSGVSLSSRCGIFIVMILLYAILSLHQRFKSKKDISKHSRNYNTRAEGATNNSAYQGLDLYNYRLIYIEAYWKR